MAVLRCTEEEKKSQMFVVGCNATREMRFAFDNPSTCAIATIDTKLSQQAVKILQAIDGMPVALQIPELYPPSIGLQSQLRNKRFRALWELSP